MTGTVAPKRWALVCLGGFLVPIAGGRWGSYIGTGSGLYLSDVLIALGTLLALATGVARPQRQRLPRLIAALPVLVLLIGLTRAAVSENEVSLVLRDCAPFVYFACLPLFIRTFSLLEARVVRRWIGVALISHAAWLLASMLGLLEPIEVPGLRVPVFFVRGDVGALLLGIMAALALSRDRWPVGRRVMLAATGTVGALAQGSRAGLLGTAMVLLLTIRLRPPRHTASMLMVLLVSGVVLAGSVWASVQGVPNWLLGLARLGFGNQEQVASGQDTQEARLRAYRLIWEWSEAVRDRAYFGDGFGSDAIASSGALQFLSGDPSVRQAHSFLFTWLAFVGLFGLAIIVFWMLYLAVLMPKHGAHGRWPRACAVGFIVAGLGGVVLESPFGFQPFVMFVALAYAHLPADVTPHSRESTQIEVRMRERYPK